MKHKIPVIPHPPYSPDLAPCDFFLFPKIKLKLKGSRFDTIDEILAETQKVLDNVTEKDFQEAFQKTEMVGPVATCGKELLRGWRRPIVLMVVLLFLQRQSGNFWINPRIWTVVECVK
jgi:hypothetical protein